MSKTVAQVLEEAAALLMRTGWCQFAMHIRHGSQEHKQRYCALGAIDRSTGGDTELAAAAVACVVKVIGDEYSLTGFNDLFAKRRTEVVELLREAARLAAE
jgi:hypothetical protein